MKELEKYITDEKTGLKYELVGDYYYLARGLRAGGTPPYRNMGTAASSLPQAVQKDFIHGIVHAEHLEFGCSY